MRSRAPEHDDFYENFCARMTQNLSELGEQLTAYISTGCPNNLTAYCIHVNNCYVYTSFNKLMFKHRIYMITKY